MVSIPQLITLVQKFQSGANTITLQKAFSQVSDSKKRKAAQAEVTWLVK
jgi:hypothetical protein